MSTFSTVWHVKDEDGIQDVCVSTSIVEDLFRLDIWGIQDAQAYIDRNEAAALVAALTDWLGSEETAE